MRLHIDWRYVAVAVIVGVLVDIGIRAVEPRITNQFPNLFKPGE